MQQGQGQRWPTEYDGSVFVAEHGSWNRDVPIGYRIANVRLRQGANGSLAAENHTVFADGWLRSSGGVWGRPVGLLRLPDDSMLVADDSAQVVYRVCYGSNCTSSRSDGSGDTSGAVRSSGAALCAALLVVLASLVLLL